MSSRRYPHRITFRQPTATTADSGQVSRSFDDAFRRWAKVKPTGSGQAESNDQQRRTTTYEITLPHSSELTAVDPDTWRIHYAGQTLNLNGMTTDRTGRQWLVSITATANH